MNPKTTPKDFFLHLTATVALYAAAIALINLVFSLIDYYNPDQLAGYFYGNSVAWPISMLVVLMPLLYVVEYFIGRDIGKSPEKISLWIRRWRIYLTLFLTGALIVGDLIALINTYLNGEITARFVYKVLAILIIAAVVFAYYLMERMAENDPLQNSGKNTKKTLTWIGIIIVVVSIVMGFVTVGSPAKQRDLKFDSQRVNDLSDIQWQVVSYWQTKGKLPASLADLTDSISGYNIPVDPQTGEQYQYALKTPDADAGLSSAMPAFELCAAFALATPDNRGRGQSGGGITYPTVAVNSYPMVGNADNWQHGAGRTCFERTIDPSKYPVTPKKAI